MVRDKELKRLENYAKALGVKITKQKKKKEDPEAAWVVDGSEIIIFTSVKESKTQLILKIVHEMAHHKSWIANGRKQDLRTNQALIRDDERDSKIDPPLPKSQRKLISETEKNDMKYWDDIIKELNIRIKPSIINKAKKLDLWVYEYYYKKGEYPTSKEYKEKKKCL